jgi:HK97 family phage major capsid protein
MFAGMFDLHGTTKRIAELKEKAKSLNAATIKENRDFTEAEKVEYESMLGEINDGRAKIEKHAAGSTLARHGSFTLGLPGESERVEGKNGESIDPRFRFESIANFLRDGSGGMRASLAEGSDLSLVLPSYEVDGFLTAYPNVDPFRQAGASIVNLQDAWTEGRVPFILAGAEPSVYAEGTGPSTDESASVAVVRLNTPKKIAFLTKPTEESMEDVSGLAAALGQEGIRRVYNKASNALTADLVASLEAAGATVAGGTDNYQDVLNMIGAVPSIFASSFNVFMMSRRSLALVRNTRAPGSGVPMFDATTNKLAGYSVVLNDFIGDGQVIFGDFTSAVHLRRTGLHFLQLNEAYRESGKVGLRFHQRADWGFFSEVADHTVIEQPLYLLLSDLGS